MVTMRAFFRLLAWPLALAACAACGDFLSVGNSNDPDRRDLLADPAELETRTAEAFRSLYGSTVGSTLGLGAQSKTMAGENDAWCPTVLSTRGAIPRMPIDNSRGNRYAGENQADFNAVSRAARGTADALHAMETWGVSSGSAARDARLRAFAWFTVGVAQGNLALFYDSSGVVDPYAELTAFPQLLGYREAMAVALAYLDSAVAWTAIAAAASGPDGFPLPSTWINGNPLTAAQFTQARLPDNRQLSGLLPGITLYGTGSSKGLGFCAIVKYGDLLCPHNLPQIIGYLVSPVITTVPN